MKKCLKVTVALLLLLAMLLPGCQGGNADYTVTLVDGNDQPYTTGIIVQVLQDGQQVQMLPLDQNGQAKFNLPKADYTVELKFTDENAAYRYDAAALTLSAKKREVQTQVIPAVKVFDSNGETYAVHVTAGQTQVTLEDGKRNYFLFNPAEAGVYRFTTSDGKATIGNYGYTAYIQSNSISKVENNVMEITVRESMVSSGDQANPFVLGIDSDGLDSCTLTIERTGDPEKTIEDEPWVIYETTSQLKPFTLPAGQLKEFDLTASTDTYNPVFNEADGYYHLNSADGPLILVQLGNPTTYLPSSISDICTTTGVKKYFYDENGNFVKREDYTQCLQEYSYTGSTGGKSNDTGDKTVYMDLASGTYPLTEDLKYIIQNHGEYAGWWDSESNGFIFVDEKGGRLVGLNPDIAWLFLCCYLET